MKKILVLIAISFVLIGCNTQLEPKKTSNVEKTMEYEKTISYQDIIEKINDINIKKRQNTRVKEIVKEYTYNVSEDDRKTVHEKKL